MNPFLSLSSGIIASFTPCVIVLFPVVMYRFFNSDKREYKQYIYFIFGFLLSFLIMGVFLRGLFNSSIVNGIKLGLGILFVVLGILSLMDRMNPLNFPIIKNPFLFGITFSLALSFNPCTLPYIGVLILLDKMSLFINMIMFGLGLLAPSVLFAIFGSKIIDYAKRTGKILHHINKLMSVVLVASGLYLAYSIKSFGKMDLYTSSGLLIIIFIVIIRSFFLINNSKDLLKPKNILLVLSLILLMYATIVHCDHSIPKEDSEILSCGLNTTCEVCKTCLNIFFLSSGLGIVGVALTSKLNFKKTLKKIDLFFRK